MNKIRTDLQESLKNELLYQPIDELEQKVLGNLDYLEQRFEDAVLRPIEDALKNAEEHIGQKEERSKIIQGELAKHKERQSYINNKISGYEKEMHLLLQGV